MCIVGTSLLFLAWTTSSAGSPFPYQGHRIFAREFGIPGILLLVCGVSGIVLTELRRIRSGLVERDVWRRARIPLAVVVVVIALVLAIGYTQPLSRIRVIVYNVSAVDAHLTVYIDNITNGQSFDVPSMAEEVVGTWWIGAGGHLVSIVSDDFLRMVYNTDTLSTHVHVLPFDAETAWFGLQYI